jgi:uncharacterized small protein (DUF1192 family)
LIGSIETPSNWRKNNMSKMEKSNTEFDSQLTLDAIPRKVGELIADLNTENNEQAITITELEVDLIALEAKIAKLEIELEKKDEEIARSSVDTLIRLHRIKNK